MVENQEICLLGFTNEQNSPHFCSLGRPKMVKRAHTARTSVEGLGVGVWGFRV